MRVVITGTSSGIGRALSERLLSRGNEVWGIARSDQSDHLRRFDARFHASRCDVAVWKQVAAIAREVEDTWPAIDALVTCAGLQGAVGRATAIDPEAWSATVRANLDGTFHAIRAFWPALARSAARGKIVCFSGGGATKPRPHFSAYGVAKTGVVRLVETIAVEECASAIDINAIAPGAINTRLTDEIIRLGPSLSGDEEYAAAQKQKATGGGSLERALDLVEWMLSPASDGISGRLISAPWDPWPTLEKRRVDLARSDIYTLRRITPEDRAVEW